MVDLMQKKSFVRTGETVISTFNFQELASGQSMLLLYGFTSKGASPAGTDYHLSSIPPRSHMQYVVSTTTFDVDFDVNILRPITLEGEALINCKWGERGGSSGANLSMIITFKLRKYNAVDGETEIASVTTETFLTAASGEYEDGTLRFVVPRTYFKEGDVLRLTAEGGTGAAPRQVALFFDTETAGDELKVWLPVRIQL